MARKKKKSVRSLLVWLFLSLVSGGGLGGYMIPDLPIIGPLIAKVLAAVESRPATEPGGLGASLARETLQKFPMAAEAVHRMTGESGGAADIGGGQPAAQLSSSRRPVNSILIASFNIQVLGKSKMAKPRVVEVLAHTLRQFDLVAIQEVRAKEDDILPQLVGAVNADGSRYDFVIGPRLGRTVSTEQYAYVFDTTRIEYDPSAVGTIQDPSDLLHREPFVARFRARTNQPDRGFTFWMVNVHTDPDEVPQEVDALADVFQVMRGARPDEDDVILLGDLNASESQLGRLGQIPGIHWTVRGVMTNTRQSKAYDNILFDAQATSEFTGRWGVYDLQGIYGISTEDALKVSDHLPVWAEFGVWEAASPGRFANRPLGGQR